MLVGGSDRKARDAAAAAFFVGHSMEYFLRNASKIPILFAADGRLSHDVDMDQSFHRLLPAAVPSASPFSVQVSAAA